MISTTTHTRCTVVNVSSHEMLRCIYGAGHGWKHYFQASGDQEICRRTRLNFGAKTVRTCALPQGHTYPCVYLSITERAATRTEMRLPPIPTYPDQPSGYPITYDLDADD